MLDPGSQASAEDNTSTHVDVKQPLIEARNIKKYFPIRRGAFNRVVGNVRAVDDVSLEVHEGETFGLVGESGCGKSTLGRVLLRLQDVTAGQIYFSGRDLLTLNARELRKTRREMQIIFQDPFGSLNPRMTVSDIISEPLAVHHVATGRARDERVAELLQLVGLDPSRRDRYPHEFSGGQRQRISIARSIALHPRFIVADEPVSALDVSVQSQVINLLGELQERLGLTYLFIAHGLNVVRHISDRVGVMYLGKMVELAGTDALFASPAHPYTAALLSAIPVPNPHRERSRVVLQGDIPSPARPPSGCRFRTRCPHAQQRCSEEEPQLQEIAPRHHVACHFPLL
ncbi:MAG TPA: dipeptide ABC transporter ATP-binding protein [Ktedonobacteraceae bacterium]|jgi:oligopeptide/dipeptide ABC transporter ATP-binding protein|nr:dipeptide ABC transporter ATP-binding protein [Ktedonobacteraceae bacterium]